MNILGNSIKSIRKSKGMTQRELSEMTGFKQNTISNHENGNRQLDETDIRTYAKALNISPQELFDIAGVSTPTPQVLHLDRELHEPRHAEWISYGDKLLDQQNAVKNSKNTVDEPIPYYTYNYYDQPASAGTGQYLNDVQVEQIELPVDINAEFVVPIYGDSMEPDYSSGDYIFVKPSVNLSDGDIGVFEYNGDAYIKQLVINKYDAFLRSLNDEYDDIPIDKNSDFRIIGEVVGKYSEK